MPFICLAQADIDDGTVNILDLLPNSSLRNLVLDPEGQTQYVNRVLNDTNVIADATTGEALFTTSGLASYLADRVQPGGAEAATGTVTIASATAGDTVTIGGVTFTAVAGGATASNQEFDDVANSGSNAATATSLEAAINDATSQGLIEAGNGGVSATANAASDVVTLTATVTGSTGELTLASSNGTRLAVSGATLTRTASDAWTQPQLVTASEAIITRLDAGQSLTLSDVNTILSAVGGDLTGSGGSGSTGTLDELLSILAGREYTVEAGAALNTTGPIAWNSAQVGSFTRDVLVFDTAVNNSASGTTVAYERKGIKSTVDGGAFQESLAQGTLSVFAGGVTIFTDNDLLPPIAGQTAQIDNARLVTVYADDGSVLA